MRKQHQRGLVEFKPRIYLVVNMYIAPDVCETPSPRTTAELG